MKVRTMATQSVVEIKRPIEAVFGFFLDWTGSTDDVAVQGYRVQALKSRSAGRVLD
jgi:hypothetical protein